MKSEKEIKLNIRERRKSIMGCQRKYPCPYCEENREIIKALKWVLK